MNAYRSRRRGQSFLEFGFIALLVAVALVGSVTLFGEHIADFYTGLTSEIDEVSPTPTPNPAHFTFSPTDPVVDEDITFDGPSSATTYDWDFGDGVGSSSVAAPVYAYDTAGEWTVTLITDEGTYSTVVEVAE